jgi:hypothetical protein
MTEPAALHHMQNVATISSGNDESIGEMIADALDKVGSNGVLSIEGSNRCGAQTACTQLCPQPCCAGAHLGLGPPLLGTS